jgi:hypothetical protein
MCQLEVLQLEKRTLNTRLQGKLEKKNASFLNKQSAPLEIGAELQDTSS